MQTRLDSGRKQVIISTEGPVVIIGEKINPTGHKKMATALVEGNYSYIRELATRQVAAGADVLDVNVGVPGLDEVALLPKIVQVVASEVDVPICLDSPNLEAIQMALAVTPGKALINSVSGEQNRLNQLLPLVKEYGAAIIALCMDDAGIPDSPKGRLTVAEKILEGGAKLGIPPEDFILDPLVMSVGADTRAGAITFETIALLRAQFGTNIVLGASNVSFGLPDRATINQAFLALAIGAGASCVISDPMKMTGVVRAADLLLGRDDYAARFIRYFRARPTEIDLPR